MTYLGAARIENGHVVMPDALGEQPRAQSYDAVEIGGDILLTRDPLDRERLAQIERHAAQSIADHRATLEGLAR
jgi:hypothetical protein